MADEQEILNQMNMDGFNRSYGGAYSGSKLQKETYEKLEKQDALYDQFIKTTYGSYENYYQVNKIFQGISVYDPTVDYIMDVTVITEEQSYKTDHISSQEVIMEALSGVCTVVFMKVDGSVGRITGTLDKKAMPTSEYETRRNFFSPLAGDRIVMWDINKQDWRSFYMDRVIKFIRDDTVALE